jgi:hypothetical protein
MVRGDIARFVVNGGWELNELRPAAMSLEEIFLQLTGTEAAVEPTSSEPANLPPPPSGGGEPPAPEAHA